MSSSPGRPIRYCSNAAECEPLLHKDKEVLRDYLDATIEGMAVAMQLVGADRAIVGIKEKYQDVIDLLRAKLPRGMEVCPLRDAYPAGDEFILVYDTLGRIIPPGGIPLAVNAVVLNVETAVNVAASASRAGNGEIPHHRRRGRRTDYAPRADRRDARAVRGRGRRSDGPGPQLHGRRRDDGHAPARPRGPRR